MFRKNLGWKMKKSEATKLVKQAIKKEHGSLKSLKVQWVEFGNDKSRHTNNPFAWGTCAVSANGFQIRGFSFSANDECWSMAQTRQAMNRIAKML